MSNTTGGRNSNALITRIVFTGVMAAIVCVVTIFRIPLGQSKVHFANSMCLLSGLLLAFGDAVETPDGGLGAETGVLPDVECEAKHALDTCLQMIDAGE